MQAASCVGPARVRFRPAYGCGGGAHRHDANLVLGYLDRIFSADARGSMPMPRRSRRIRCRGSSAEPRRTADGICRVVNTNMAEGISVVPVRRGVDQALHAARFRRRGGRTTGVARMLEISRVVVPRTRCFRLARSRAICAEYVRTCITAADDACARCATPCVRWEKDGRAHRRGLLRTVEFRRSLTCGSASRSSRSTCR